MPVIQIRRVLAAIAMLIALGPAAPAFAQQAPRPGASAAAVQPMTPDEARDWAIVQATFDEFRKDGYPGIAPHLPALREALGRAPASYPVIERRDGVVIIRAEGDPALLFGLTLSAADAKPGAANGAAAATNYIQSANVYPSIAMLLGSFAVEMQNYEEAVAILDKGLAMQPNNTLLLVERGGALLALKRPADADASYTQALESEDLIVQFDRARLLRSRGVARIDLGRLEDAETDLKESLRLEPGNALARNELHYIAALRNGAPPTDVQLANPSTRKKD